MDCSFTSSPLFQGGGGVKQGEILSALRNSPKGQLRYDTGWDEKPHAVYHLISQVQAEEDLPKHAVLARAVRVSLSDQEEYQFSFETETETDTAPATNLSNGGGGGVSLGTSSGSGSRRMSLSESGHRCPHHPHKIQTDEVDGTKKRLSTTPRRRGYGIREEEYDDEELARQFQLQQNVERKDHLKELLRGYEARLLEKVDKKAHDLRIQLEEGLNEAVESLTIDTKTQNLQKILDEYRKDASDTIDKIFDQIETEVERTYASKAEIAELDHQYEIKKSQLKEKKAKETEAAAAKAAAARAAEERERQIKLQEKLAQEAAELEQQQLKIIELEEEEKRREREEAELKIAEKEAELKLAEKEDSAKSVASLLQGCILKEDCDKYNRCNILIHDYEAATKDIVANSPNIDVKKFYGAAIKCINTPLNAVANTDPRQVSEKAIHFINLIEGKPVTGSSTMTAPFSAAALPNGQQFVLRMLVYRFVKKAESEILSEKKGFLPLAEIALTLSKRFPVWTSLLEAYFYKLCPFLVPFSFPRGDQSLEEYCTTLGYDLKGSESTIMNELLARIKGYCSLYCIIVLTYEKSGPLEGDTTPFFTIGGVWEILVKTMKLDPQPDATVTVIQTILELLSERLVQTYGPQFTKLMNTLISQYLPKMDKVSFGASKSGVMRFQTFLEQKFQLR